MPAPDFKVAYADRSPQHDGRGRLRLCILIDGKPGDVCWVDVANPSARRAVARDWSQRYGILESAIQEKFSLISIAETSAQQDDPGPRNFLSDMPRPELPDFDANGRANVYVSPDEHLSVEAATRGLVLDDDLYQRGPFIVRAIAVSEARAADPTDDDVTRPTTELIVQQLPTSDLRRRLSAKAKFLSWGPDHSLHSAHPPEWAVREIETAAGWPGMRTLLGISDAPILRPDGSIHDTKGYDELTCMLYRPGVSVPAVLTAITEEVAQDALTQLLEAVCDFPFQHEVHRSAWLAALLTPLARTAFTGPAPLFLMDANVRGAGKTLLAQVIGRIALGCEIPVTSYKPEDTEEFRKKITGIAIAGDRLVLLDNLGGKLGDDTLDRVLTTSRWRDRILGRNDVQSFPMTTIWYATGNNVQVANDTSRRVIPIRLDCLEEHPEDRDTFRMPDLIGWTARNRGRLIQCAYTVLAYHLTSADPCPAMTRMGGFEDWSRVVRGAILRLGLPDPQIAQRHFEAESDSKTETLSQLLEAWQRYDVHTLGFSAAEILRELYERGRDYGSRVAEANYLRDAIETITGASAGRPPNARQLAFQLRMARRRVIRGRYFESQNGQASMRRWVAQTKGQEVRAAAINREEEQPGLNYGQADGGTPF